RRSHPFLHSFPTRRSSDLMTNSRSTVLTALRWLARALVLAAAYFVVARIGLRYATIGPSISPVWPPTGLAVAALVILGPGYWPADRKSTRLNSSHVNISYA